MILYLDTSALVKEPGTDEILSFWKKSSAIITSCMAYAETLASIYRKHHEVMLKRTVLRNVLNTFEHDWESFIHVEVTDGLNDLISRIIMNYPLRGFDAIHLASALIVSERIPEDFIFICFDKRLTHAAKQEGLVTFPEEDKVIK